MNAAFKKTREYNIAIVGLTFPLQFHAHLYQICLPSQDNTDSNAGQYGFWLIEFLVFYLKDTFEL